MPRSDRTARYSSTALDRALAPARTVVTVGPIEGLDVERVRAVLVAAESLSPAPRLALIPDAARRTWGYGSESVHIAVRPDVNTDDVADLVTAIRNRAGERRPVEVLVCGDYLVLDYSHGVGDGQFGVLGLAVLAGGDASAANILADGLSSTAIWTALWRHYRSNPGALRDFWRLRKANKRFEVADAGDGRRIENWEAAKCSVAAHLEAAKVDRLRAWAKETWPGATTASVTIALWLAALRAENVPFEEHVMILMNCRRYLGGEYRTIQGNFAVGIPVPIPDTASPSEIAELVRQVIDSGWPIAILGMAEVKSRVRPQVPGSPAGSVVVPNRLRLAVSDLGRLGMFDQLGFRPGRPPQLSAYLEPDGADAATLLVDELAGGRTFTASFCSEMIEPAVIERALGRMCDDPVSLLAGG